MVDTFDPMRQFTLDQLRLFNGKNGAPAYIACQGYVYDVTQSFLWQEGRHQALHTAGEDLSRALELAPHGTDLLDRFPMIGILSKPSQDACRSS
jgi:predicted heme/steroid binding protein